jgi:hypothetical protein
VANPGLTISYTPRVLPSGLDDNGIGVLASAKRDGFNPDVVNVRAMNYGASVDNGGNGAGRTGGALEHSAAGCEFARGLGRFQRLYCALVYVFRRPRQRLLRQLRRCSSDLQRYRPVALRLFCDLRGEVAPIPGLVRAKLRGVSRLAAPLFIELDQASEADRLIAF